MITSAAEYQQQIVALQERLRLQELISDLSTSLIDLPPSAVDGQIEQGLKRIVEFLGIDRSAFAEFSADMSQLYVTHTYGGLGVALSSGVFLNRVLPWYAAKLHRGEIFKLEHPDDLPEEAVAEKAYYQQVGLKSNLSIPVSVGGSMLCVLGFTCFQASRSWPDELVEQLRRVAEIFAHAIFRKRAEQRLESQYQFERLVSDLSARFVNTPSDQVDHQIKTALQKILEFFQVDRCVFRKVLREKAEAPLIYACHAEGIQEAPDTISYQEECPWLAEKVLSGETVSLHVKDFPPEAAIDRRSFERLGMRSQLVIPLQVGGSVSHLLAISTVRNERTWPEEAIARLRLAGEIFVNALERAQSEHRFRDLLESAPNAMIISDRQGRIILINAQAEKLFGYTREELLGMDIEALMPAAHRHQHLQYRQGYYADPKVRPMDVARDLQGLRKDGSIFPIEVSLGPIQTSEGTVIMATVLDITERKRAEQRLEHQYQFERLISELSARFVNIPPDQVDHEIERALQQILEYFQVDRCGLIRVSDNEGAHLTHACYAAGIPTVPDTIKYNEYYPWHAEKILSGETVHLHIKDLPPEAARDRQSFEQMGIRANLAIPLMVGGAVDYVVVINSVRSERLWTEEQISRVRLLGEIFVNALVRKRAEEELKKSYHEIKQLKDRLQLEADYLREEIKVSHRHGDIVSQSEAMQRVLRQVEQVAPSDSSVLIQGETGSGKELIAEAIHNLSPRQDHVMVKVNCASLPVTLIESELFGREKGAYTGAMARQIGRFEVADGSTIFFDEVSELPMEVQAKLLRVLQEGEFERLGSPKTIKVDVRVIAASNRDLAEAVQNGLFREDLYYRLNVFPIEVPPLRERLADMPELVWTFVEEFGKRMGKNIQKISKRTMEDLQRYPWPGNIRELRNVIERAMIISTGSTLSVQIPMLKEAPAGRLLTMAEMEAKHIKEVLEKTHGRIRGENGAAAILGLNPSTLYSRMEKLGIQYKRENIG